MKKLIVGVTAPGSVILIEGQLKYFKELGYATYLICPYDERVKEYCERENCIHLPVNINREMTFISDIKTFFQIYRHFKIVRPDIVNVGTSKMGFLGTVAGAMSGVKFRVYTARGLRYETETGIKRIILKTVLKTINLLAHKIICISDAVKDKGIQNNVFSKSKALVINKGSSNGIDLNRFNINKVNQIEKEKIIHELNLKDKFVFGFIGRLNDRKGINELYKAFNNLYQKDNTYRLVIVGPAESTQIKNKELLINIQKHPGILLVGFQKDIPTYLSLMDIFVLPTWTEGFGNVLIQAAALGIPIVSTKALGVQNAVNDGYNGVLVSPKNDIELENAMYILANDPDKRQEFKTNGILWSKHFSREKTWEGMREIYEGK